jgi:phage shock protein A
MREAVVEAKVAVQETREAVTRTERELAQERQRLADAERRGRLAAEIQDGETAEIAHRFAAKHRERMGVLEKKVAALHDELGLYERELGDMQAQLGRAERERPQTEAERAARAPASTRRRSCSSRNWTALPARRRLTASSRSSRRR